MHSSSISLWVERLKQGDEEAAERIWREYFNSLVSLARHRLGDGPRRAADEDDIAQSAFFSLCRGAQKGRFPKLNDRDDLWQLLVMLTREKVIQEIRRQKRLKRGSGEVRGESVFGDPQMGHGLNDVELDQPTPEFLTQLDEEFQGLMEMLGEGGLRRVALARMDGFTNREIAAQLNITERSIERKVKLIRQILELRISSGDV